MTRKRAAWVAVCILAVAAAVACVVNPVTGKRELSLVSQQQELALGASSDKEVVAQMGLVEDPALQDYVASVGRKLAALSERPELPWSFRVIDDPVVNAFALPGGYIYITRGILAHFNSESEMAAVLGHEIGHVTARHGASQMSKQMVAQLGLGVGAVLAPEAAEQFGELASIASGLLFLKFGRDDERQADDLGLRYSVAGGFDPRPMTDVFRTLGRVGRASGGEQVPSWLSTHPAPENREERIRASIAAMRRDFSGSIVERESYLSRVDGIVFGDDPREGYFEGTEFFHPQMKFQVKFPEDWKTANIRSAVRAMSQAAGAAIEITLAAQADPVTALADFESKEGTTTTGRYAPRLLGRPASGVSFSAKSETAEYRGVVAFVDHNGRVLRLLGWGSATHWATSGDLVRRSIESFAQLTDPKALNAQPARIRIVKPTRPMSTAEFASAYGGKVSAETLATMNGLEADGRYVGGRTYKGVR